MENMSTTQPHFIPGYTGYSPQYIYRVGDTYGKVTHKLLIDPCVGHSENLILSNRIKDDYKVIKPTLDEIDLIKDHERRTDAVYKHPIIPGYEGFIPFLKTQIGDRYFVAGTEAIAEFEKHMQKLKCEARVLKHRTVLADKNAYSRSVGERSFQTNDYRLPLEAVRPEAEGVIRRTTKTELPKAPPLPYSKESPPHFIENDDPEKYIKAGFSGHVPFTWPRFGQGNKPMTNSALCDFTNNYHHRRSTEWAPVSNAGIGTSKPSGPVYEIYLKNIGLLPSYGGHVPGAQFRFGKTFGNDTVNVKRWFSNNE